MYLYFCPRVSIVEPKLLLLTSKQQTRIAAPAQDACSIIRYLEDCLFDLTEKIKTVAINKKNFSVHDFIRVADQDSIGSVDSESGSSRAKIRHKRRKKICFEVFF